jgi:hypothetical protein
MTDELKAKSLGRFRTQDGYSQGTGQLTGRDKDAQKRKEKRADQLQAEGKSKDEANAIALKEMQDNPRKDWRAG